MTTHGDKPWDRLSEVGRELLDEYTWLWYEAGDADQPDDTLTRRERAAYLTLPRAAQAIVDDEVVFDEWCDVWAFTPLPRRAEDGER